MAKRRVGLVGCGRWGALILRDLRALGCDVAVVHLEGGPPPRSSAAEGAAVVKTIAELRALAGLPD